ncbi:unnamed protein product [Adineta steineri]|uniref:Cyclic nucleotide-binding domain-containing protein n=1 Tax=Adineta steineri TaxID=433720 RepID=A0A818WSG2_9BILA|nr:unnamed protein product [Adineta steineri]CAF1229895.1 unnamed protein product [Adineta steineri]CAF3730050.1 unnamed protein product [Adineta steineri]CAF4039059.1 unnamed protein product [Adineta steineri]
MTQIEVPTELPVILRNFTLSVLRTKPRDIINHAVEYFTQLQQQSQLMTGDNRVTTVPHSSFASISHCEQQQPASKHNVVFSENATIMENNKIVSEKENTMTNSANISINCISPTASENQSEEDDVLGADEDMRRQYIKKNDSRRVSVAAERYNPEDDDSDDEEFHTYPKSLEQRQRLREAVRYNFLFRTLELKQIDYILDAMWEKHVTKGEHIIQQGKDGDNFYIIDKGLYEVYVLKESDSNNQPIKIGEYNQTGSFGELALMYNQPRSATIIAVTDGTLWVMGRQTFRKLVLKHAFRKRQMYENFLRDVDILQSLTDYERSNVADALIPIDFYQNDIVIKQGDEGDKMFFIEDGKCDIVVNEKCHKRLQKGDYFGELALLNHEPRSATVIAASHKVRLASLEVQSFERLLGPCMDLLHRNTSKYLK